MEETAEKINREIEKTEQEKVQELYELIGERGLYVNTNYDVFTHPPERVSLNPAFHIDIIKEGRAYDSSLLFATLTSLLKHGTMLVRGSYGIGKTTSAEIAGHFFHGIPLDKILEAEILGNPDLRREEMTGSLDTVKMVYSGEKLVLPSKFLSCPVKIWDEVNRTPADLLSATMKLVDTGKATYQGVLLESPPGILISTENYSDEGTFQPTPPFIDRHDVAVIVTSPPHWDLKKIRARGDEKLNGRLEELLKIPEGLKLNHEKIRQQISSLDEETLDRVPQVSSFADFVYASLRFSEAASSNIGRATKGNTPYIKDDDSGFSSHFKSGTGDYPFILTRDELSIRTVQTMHRYSKAFAWFQGKNRVELKDLKTVLPYLLWHKIQPTEKITKNNPMFINDRIGFVEYLITLMENEYNTVQGDENLDLYNLTLNVIRNRKIEDRKLSEEEIRNIMINASTKLGAIDRPYGLTLAHHLVSEYTTHFIQNQ